MKGWEGWRHSKCVKRTEISPQKKFPDKIPPKKHVFFFRLFQFFKNRTSLKDRHRRLLKNRFKKTHPTPPRGRIRGRGQTIQILLESRRKARFSDESEDLEKGKIISSSYLDFLGITNHFHIAQMFRHLTCPGILTSSPTKSS